MLTCISCGCICCVFGCWHAGEKKLFAELEQMKALVEQLRTQNQQLVGPTSGGGDMVQLQVRSPCANIRLSHLLLVC